MELDRTCETEQVLFQPGSLMKGDGTGPASVLLRDAAVRAASHSHSGVDAIIAVLGHDCSFENEGVDRSDDELGLPPTQLKLLQALSLAAATEKTPLILVLVNGMAVSTPWASKNIPVASPIQK